MVPGQRSLFAAGVPLIDRDATWERVDLGDGSWIDVARDYLRGADTVLDDLVDTVPWQSGRRFMYDRMVDDPRLSHRYAGVREVPHPVLAEVRAELVDRYRVPLGALASTSTATVATAWRSTTIASCASSTTPWW